MRYGKISKFLGYSKMNTMLDSDIAELIAKQQYFAPLENTAILVTGSTGLIGSLIVKSLCAYAQKMQKRIRVYACCRSREKFDEVFKPEELV